MCYLRSSKSSSRRQIGDAKISMKFDPSVVIIIQIQTSTSSNQLKFSFNLLVYLIKHFHTFQKI